MRELDISLSKKTEEGIYTFKLAGSLGVEGSGGLTKLFDACLKEKVYSIIIDLSQVDFISSAGMGVFLSVVGELREHNGDIIFMAMPDKIRKIFSSLDVLDYFENYKSEDKARTALRKKGKKTTGEVAKTKKALSKLDHLQFISESTKSISLEKKSVLVIPSIMESLMSHLDVEDLLFVPISIPLRQEFDFISLGRGNLREITVEETQQLSSLLKNYQAPVQLSELPDVYEDIYVKLARTGCELVVPIFSEEILSSLLFLGQRGLGARYQKEDMLMLQTIAGMLGSAIQNHRLQKRLDDAVSSEELENAHVRLERKVQELETLFIVSQQLGSSMEVDELLNNFLVVTVGQMGTNKGLIFLTDEGDYNLTCKAFKGQFARIPLDVTLPIDGKLVQLVSSANHPIKAHDKDVFNKLSSDERKFITDNDISLLGAIKYKGELRGLNAVGSKVSKKEYTTEDFDLFSILNFQAATALENVKLFDKLKNVYSGVMRALVTALEAKDPHYKGHTERVTRLSAQMGEKLGFNNERLRNLIFGAVLHDIGRVGVRESILNKVEPLTEEEKEELMRHPVIGTEILKEVEFFKGSLAIVRNHHENYDGSGYPDGLAGESIPIDVRIVTLANAYEAMTSTRRYRGALTNKEAIEEIRRNAGTQFDPNLAKIFINLISSR